MTVPYREPSWPEIAAAIAAGIPLYFIFSFLGEEFRGFVASISTAIIVLLWFALEPLRNERRFLLALAMVAIVHAILVIALPYTGSFRYGFVFFPLFFLDAYVCARFIIYFCGGRLD
jgi:hypothetical protein